MADLVNLIKRAAVDAVEGEKPAGVLFGTVTSVSPLQVSVEQRLTLGAEMLVLTSNVTDYAAEMTFDHRTEPTIFSTAHDHPCVGATVGEGSFNSVHSHQVLGKKQVIVHNGLKAGEKVILLRMQGDRSSSFSTGYGMKHSFIPEKLHSEFFKDIMMGCAYIR